MSKADTWMPLYVGDYLRDTGHLSTAEHGAYMLLLMAAWTRGGALPVEDDRLRALARMERKEWAKARAAVLAFFVREGDAYRNPRLDREIERAARNSEERRKAGAAGAAKRWQGDGKPIANAMANAMAEPSRPGSQNDAPSPSPVEEPPSPPSVVRSPRGGRLPAGWVPMAADATFALSLGLDVNRTAAQFRDYWHAKAGKDAAKLDWSATWRGWCRREAERRPSARTAPQRESKTAWMAPILAPIAAAPPPYDLDLTAEECPA